MGKLDAEQLKAYTRLQVTRMERGLVWSEACSFLKSWSVRLP
jgi:hypothetical protein